LLVAIDYPRAFGPRAERNGIDRAYQQQPRDLSALPLAALSKSAFYYARRVTGGDNALMQIKEPVAAE